MVRLRSPWAQSEVEAPKKLAFRIVATAKSKKALKALILDMRNVADFCDYFVILSGTSLRHVNAIAQAIEADLSHPPLEYKEALSEKPDSDKGGIKSLSKVSPNDESGWIVLDFLSVVVHIFYKPMREFYSLERLWSDAKRVRIPKKL
jgi:ribosome-associated protein